MYSNFNLALLVSIMFLRSILDTFYQTSRENTLKYTESLKVQCRKCDMVKRNKISFHFSFHDSILKCHGDTNMKNKMLLLCTN